MIRRTFVCMAAATLALLVVLTPATPQARGRAGPQGQSGQQDGLKTLRAQVQALEQQVAGLAAELTAVGTAAGARDADLQAQIDSANGQLAAFGQLLDQFTPRLGGAEGNITTLRAQTAALEQKATEVTAALEALSLEAGTLDDALAAHVGDVSAQLIGFQQLLDQYNEGLSAAEAKIATMEGKVADLEAQVAALGGGLTSYDALAGLPCTTVTGTQSTVKLAGFLKTPICADAVSSSSRFVDLGTVVFDQQTNLMWEKKTTATGSVHDVSNIYDWFTATGNWITAVNAEVFAGFSNWRVPTPEELLTIVDMNFGPPRIDPIFGATSGGRYWSSNADGSTNARYVSFNIGNTGSLSKSTTFAVRAVRSGP